MDEAVEWAKRAPNPMPGPSDLEIRPFYEYEDFAEVMTPERDPRAGRADARGAGEAVGNFYKIWAHLN